MNKIARKIFTLSNVLILMTGIMLPFNTLSAHAATTVDLSLVPSSQTVAVGDIFDVVIQIECGTQQINSLDVFL